MADAWGGSWGTAWGVSWGSGTTPTVISTSAGRHGTSYAYKTLSQLKREKAALLARKRVLRRVEESPLPLPPSPLALLLMGQVKAAVTEAANDPQIETERELARIMRLTEERAYWAWRKALRAIMDDEEDTTVLLLFG